MEQVIKTEQKQNVLQRAQIIFRRKKQSKQNSRKTESLMFLVRQTSQLKKFGWYEDRQMPQLQTEMLEEFACVGGLLHQYSRNPLLE